MNSDSVLEYLQLQMYCVSVLHDANNYNKDPYVFIYNTIVLVQFIMY